VKIAVVGCGAVGSYYGGRLSRAGHEVHFLLRSDYDAVRRNGVLIRSPQGDFRVRPKCARRPEEIGISDLVLIAIKTTANDQFANLLPPLIGPQTIVCTFQNGLGNEEALTAFAAPGQIMGGLCFVCLNRVEPGVVHHIDHGMIVLGEFQGYPEPRTHDLATTIRNSGVPCKVSDNLRRAHWEKLVWNIPFNGLGVAGAAGYESVINGTLTAGADSLGETLTTDQLLRDRNWENLARELMQETVAAAGALGFNIDSAIVDKQIERTRSMGAYKASTLIDFERGQPLELRSLFLEPLRLATEAGVPTPRLKNLCAVLAQLDPGARTDAAERQAGGSRSANAA
jgi:2-dehydropantoate 2-reductase